VKSHFELEPADYERARQGHLQRRRVTLVAADVASRAHTGDLVVEIGSGPGDVLAALAAERADVRFLGIDTDEAMIAHAESTHASENASFRVLDLVDEPLGETARVIFCIDVLHHVHGLDRLAARIAQMLEPDGLWTSIEPNSRNPYIWFRQERMRRAGLDEDHFRPDVFDRAVASAGLCVVGRTTAFLVPGRVQSVPRVAAWGEGFLERVPFLGGSIVYRVAFA
jgi:trans-aconitate methyltransferase